MDQTQIAEIVPTPPEPIATETAQRAAEPTNQELLELETARKERIEAETRLEAAKKETSEATDKVRESNRRMREVNTFRDSKVRFHAPMSEVMDLLRKESEEVTVAEDGEQTFILDGKPLTLEAALVELGVKNPLLVDQRTLPRQERLRSEKRLSKADLLTSSAKATFISEHGLKAFEALPMRSVDPFEVTTPEQYQRLSRIEKSELIARIGEEGVTRILSRPRQRVFISEKLRTKINR